MGQQWKFGWFPQTHTRGSSHQSCKSYATVKYGFLTCSPNTLIMSCLYPPPPYFFLFLFTHFLSPAIHPTFVCTKCWCLSYVFSAFGLFSYCLPGLFGSGPAQPVRCFSRFACVLIGERLRLSAYHHFTTVSLSVCLSLSCMSLPHPLWSILLHSYHAFPTSIQSPSSRVSSFPDMHPLFYVCVPLNLHL